MNGIKTFHIVARIEDFKPEHLSNGDIDMCIQDIMEVLPNLQHITIKIRDKDYNGGGSIELLGTFFDCVIRLAPHTCVIDVDDIELAELEDYFAHIGLDDVNMGISNRVLSVSTLGDWPETITIRDAAFGAIPGCPRDTIGVSFNVTGMSERRGSLGPPAQIYKAERFHNFHLVRDPDGTAIWRDLRIHLTLRASDVGIVGGVGELLSSETAVFQLLMVFVREKKLRELDLGNDVPLLDTLPADIVLDSISRFAAGSAFGAFAMKATAVSSPLPRVLSRFPNAVALEGPPSIFLISLGLGDAQ
ncbi:hypothetical protein M427DRAFT_33342 [Gonapodya prolifera JEL478]|uniref:Uncharacterized protein n=1 Tax=Gonapodya prolifera (strain JEL478) TaxID=1344416 RepID=A0A139ABP2_GONPJ|nr:hypothetical protein M427DRAFT_33342 [Gonapodya prolifera JEL478]|eukprot:KXS14138.1 hypothetical protein M427DRAFT_33342 [Gonapodya prolifera JEL478]